LEFGLQWYVNVAIIKIKVSDVLNVPVIKTRIFSEEPAVCIIYLMIETAGSNICALNQIT
jgi:hypothetical protein